jgi:hypothetical protein
MKLVTINQLTELTGKAHQTIKNKLVCLDVIKENDNSFLYDSKKALDLIYGVEEPSDLKEKREREEIAYTQAKRIKVELETRVLEENLIDADEVNQIWAKLITAFRSKILSIPTKSAIELTYMKQAEEIEDLLKKYCEEALNELSNLQEFSSGEAGALDAGTGSATP